MTVMENLEMGGYTVSDSTELRRRIEVAFAHFPILAERHTQTAVMGTFVPKQLLTVAGNQGNRPVLPSFMN